jgi:hypothetical protein
LDRRCVAKKQHHHPQASRREFLQGSHNNVSQTSPSYHPLFPK